MSGEGMVTPGALPVRFDQAEMNHDPHGRWIGLFKLTEECGELVVAAVDLLDSLSPIPPDLVTALQGEMADVSAACRYLVEASNLNATRIGARELRQVELVTADASLLDLLIRRAGALVQLLGKVAAFPDGNEHPDGAGNIDGRMEVAIADLTASIARVCSAYRLPTAAMEVRVASKLALFRQWCPTQGAGGETVS